MPATPCPFCHLDANRILLENEVGVAIRDAFPVTEGHTLVIPRQHVVSVFDLDTKEQAALWDLAREVHARLAQEFQPAGFNVGVNDGKAAGQTVMHAHIHIIPRYSGDSEDPRGGIRRVMPKKARQSAPDEWKSLLGEVNATVCVMPLWKLQTVGDERLDFLYDNLDSGKTITLKPGAAYCLRAFYGLLRDLIQGAWVRFVQKLNSLRLGNITDLGTFLFGHECNALDSYRGPLMEVQGGDCFYCRKPLSRQVEVDHFIPWSRYPTDLGHNFVLSHSQCNNSKSDHLAAEEHLAAWTERAKAHGDRLDELLTRAELPHDLPASIRIAQWAYEQTEKSQGQVWVEKKLLRHLGPGWRGLLVA